MLFPNFPSERLPRAVLIKNEPLIDERLQVSGILLLMPVA